MSVDHYQRLISILSEATLILTSSGCLLAANQAASALFGESTLSEGRFLQSYSTSSSDTLLSYLRQCSRTRQPLMGAVELTTPEGVRPFTMKGAVLEPGDDERESIILLRLFPKEEVNARFQALKAQIDGLNLEISKRQRAEYELRAQKLWLEVTLASIGDAVITTDTQSRITFMNPVAEAKTGWTQEEAAGKPLADIFVIINEYTRGPVESPVETALREGRVVELANHTILITKSSDEISIEDTAAPIKLEDQTEGAILVFHDVSDRRYLERELIERAETLELANRHKNEFLTMLAHELRSPLAPISNAIELMGMQADTPASLDEPRKMIARQVQHLKRLIDDMLDVSRITRGKMNVVPEIVDFASLVRLACADFQGQLDQGGIDLEVLAPSSQIWVCADPDRLTQVLHNLLTNAIKFTPSGGSVSVSLATEDDTAVLQVADTGIGLDPSVMKELFEPFTQASQNLDRSTGGLGLGLSLVKGIVDLHYGEITAASGGPQKGTTIKISLPLVEKNEDDEETNVANAPSIAVPTHRILLIEDGKDTAAIMRQLLTLLGHEVHVANTGPKGLKMAVAIAPTLIICDIGLPGLDGFAVAEQLRKKAITASIPLVALTGYGGSDFVQRAKQAGFDHHITKPASLSDIQEVLRLTPDVGEHPLP